MTSPTPPPLPEYGTCCQACQTFGPVKQVMFLQQIGAVIIRFHRRVEGQLCRNCVNEHFAKTTLITSLLGWWGLISFILTPFFLLNNVIRYLSCLGLKPVDEGSQRGMGLALIAIVIAVGALSLPAYIIIRAIMGGS